MQPSIDKMILISDVIAIDTIINSLAQNPDIRQECWLALLSSKQSFFSTDGISHVCMPIIQKERRTLNNSTFKNISIETPITSSSPDTLTIADTLLNTDSSLSPDNQEPGQFLNAEYDNINGKGANKSGAVVIDKDTLRVIQERYPLLPLKHAIRALVGLPPLTEKARMWQPWEDAILRDFFPQGGTLSCKDKLLGRSSNAIITRANDIGVHRGKFKPDPSLYSTEETASILGCHPTTLLKWVKRGLISISMVRGFHRFGHGFFTEATVIRFIKEHFLYCNVEKMSSHFKHYLPSNISDYTNVVNAARVMHTSQFAIRKYIQQGLLEELRGWDNQHFINLTKLKDLHFRPHIRVKNPYKVAKVGNLLHYICRIDKEPTISKHASCYKVWTYCNRNNEMGDTITMDDLSHNYGNSRPTCKRCKALLDRLQGITHVATVNVTCDNCGATFGKLKSYAERTKHNFCNKKCQGQWVGTKNKGKVYSPSKVIKKRGRH